MLYYAFLREFTAAIESQGFRVTPIDGNAVFIDATKFRAPQLTLEIRPDSFSFYASIRIKKLVRKSKVEDAIRPLAWPSIRRFMVMNGFVDIDAYMLTSYTPEEKERMTALLNDPDDAAQRAISILQTLHQIYEKLASLKYLA